ncbi:S-layer homology domain-containing protein [Paenibacillus luteus]|uniref:S-layer homology domain-containing protein n=1 Tax=Paenibacillus luteus TaxID=2545753 RepID=UPI001143DCB8|nr:S-layer homology domain-containing protein [Paenibacillus luteus]
MQNKMFKRSFLLLMILLLALGHAFTAMAATTVDIVSTVNQQNGSKDVVLKSVIDVEKEDYAYLMGGKTIEFTLVDANNTIVAPSIKKQIEDHKVSVIDSTYSIPFTDLAFEGLKPGTAYKLKAAFHSETRPLQWEQTVNILPTAYTFKVERTAKEGGNATLVTNATIRTDDKNITVTVLDEYGKPAVGKSVSMVYYNYLSSIKLTTNEDGQIVLNGQGGVPIHNSWNPVLFLQVDENLPSYTVETLYVQDILESRYKNYRAVELQYRDKDSRLLSGVMNTSYEYGQGNIDSFKTAGVVVYLTNGSLGTLKSTIKSPISNETYLYELSAEELAPTLDGQPKQLILNAAEYSKVSFQYKWDDQPVHVKSLALNNNSGSRQVFRDENAKLANVETLYMAKGKTFQFAAELELPNGDKAVVSNVINTIQPSLTFSDNLSSSRFSAISIDADYRNSKEDAALLVSYVNNRYNYYQLSTQLAVDKRVFVETNKTIYKMNATINAAGDQAIIASDFLPIKSSYTFKSGKSVVTTVEVGVEKLGRLEQRNELILGESLSLQAKYKDENGQALDINSSSKIVINKDNELYSDNNYLYSSYSSKSEILDQYYYYDFLATEVGNYTIKFLQKNDKNEWAEQSSSSFTVAPKREFDVEIRDQNGNLIDLVNKPYITNVNSKQLKFTVREHITGQTGAPVAGVTLLEYNEMTLRSDANGQITLANDYLNGHNQFTFSKSGYLNKSIHLYGIDPKTEAIVRVSGLDKPESSDQLNVPGGIPMQNASVYATIQAGTTTSWQQGSAYYNDTVSYMIVPSPSKVKIDFIRSNNWYNNSSSSPFGYYMIGNVNTEPGKDYNLVLDARQPLQQVSTVNVSERVSQVSIIHKDLTSIGAYDSNTILSGNREDQNKFYATKGIYNVLARTIEGNLIYLENIELSQDVNSLDIPSNSNSLATIKMVGDAYINSITYVTDNHSQLRSYTNNYQSELVNVTPGNIWVSLSAFDGSKQYYYEMLLTKEELKAGQQTDITLSPLKGIDILNLDSSGKLTLPPDRKLIQLGLVNEHGDSITQYATPKLLVFNKYWNIGSQDILPENVKVTIKDGKGNVIEERDELYYFPGYFYVERGGDYTVTATLTLDGNTYTLDKKIKVVISGEENTDPGTGPGTTPSTTPSPTPSPTPAPGTGTGTGPVTGGGVPTPTPTAAAADKGLQELLENSNSDKEKADKAADLINGVLAAVKEIKDAKEAEKSVQNVSSTLAAASKLLDSMKTADEKAKITASITQMVNNTKYAFEQIEDGPKAIELAKSIIKDTTAVLQSLGSTDAAQLNELKDSLVLLSKQAVEKAASITLDSKNIKVEGNALMTTLDAQQIAQQLETTKAALSETVKELSAAVGADKAASINPVITIHIPKQSENVTKLAADLPSEIYQAVQASGLAGLKLSMGNIGFTVEPDTFGSVTSGQTITLAAETVHNLTVTAPASAAQVANIPVMEFQATIDGKKVEAFQKPMPVTFDVSAIDTSKYTEADLANLTVYLLNEKTLTWEPVGGLYDPVTKTVNVKRGHFSKYTVMKSTVSFKDIAATHWAATAVNTLLAKGVLDQTTSFGPSLKVTREQFAAWLVRSYGLDGTGLSLPFTDVAKNSEYYDEIAVAYQQGLIQGKTATTFEPKAEITRQEIATLLSRALEAYNSKKLAATTSDNQLKGFKDASTIAVWAKDGVALLKQQNLITGYEDGTYKPKQTTTKAEAAALIYRIYSGQ